LIHIMRAEVYEATVGLNEKTANWGTYISRMDSTLRGLLNDLAVSRGKRMKLEKGDAMLVDFNEFMRKFARAEQKSTQTPSQGLKMRRMPGFSRARAVRSELLAMWEKDYPKLKSILKREKKVGGKKTKTS
jgi:hypothetical protein